MNCSRVTNDATNEASEEEASPRPAVLKSHVDQGDDAVVLMTSGTMICTGTVIAPTYVLTAAHCVAAAGDPRTHTVRAGGIRVARFHTPSGALEEVDAQSYHNDVAVLELAKPTDVAPLPINFDGDALDDVDTIRTVGFGKSGTYAHDGGVKRNGTARVTHSTNYVVTVPGTGGICYGDSGGPAVARVHGKEMIVGVTSHVSEEECERGRSVFVRTDRQREFLARFVSQEKEQERADAPPRESPRVHRHRHSRSSPPPLENTPDAPNVPSAPFDLTRNDGALRVSIDANGRIVVVQNGRVIVD